MANFYGYFVKAVRWVNIRDIKTTDLAEFPLVLRLVLHQGFDDDALEREGYANVDAYFDGQSMYNSSVMGWRGHNSDGTIRGQPEEIFGKVKHPRVWRKFLKHLELDLDNGSTKRINISELEMDDTLPHYPDNVINIFLDKIEGIKETKLLSLGFDKMSKHKVDKLEVALFDKALLTRRPLHSLSPFLDGERIKVKQSENEELQELTFNIELNQNRFLAEDTDKNCVNYPTKEYRSFMDCDDHFQQKFLTENVAYQPFWAFRDGGRHEAIVGPSWPGQWIYMLYSGALVQGCLTRSI
jgi:hypothetical protein